MQFILESFFYLKAEAAHLGWKVRNLLCSSPLEQYWALPWKASWKGVADYMDVRKVCTVLIPRGSCACKTWSWLMLLILAFSWLGRVVLGVQCNVLLEWVREVFCFPPSKLLLWLKEIRTSILGRGALSLSQWGYKMGISNVFLAILVVFLDFKMRLTRAPKVPKVLLVDYRASTQIFQKWAGDSLSVHVFLQKLVRMGLVCEISSWSIHSVFCLPVKVLACVYVKMMCYFLYWMWSIFTWDPTGC